MARNIDGFCRGKNQWAQQDCAPTGLTTSATETEQDSTLEKLEALRAELADLAFKLESRGRLDAADLAMSVAARVGALCEELAVSDES